MDEASLWSFAVLDALDVLDWGFDCFAEIVADCDYFLYLG